MHINMWRKTVWEAYILYNSKNTTFWKRQNYEDNKRIIDCLTARRRDKQIELRDFLKAMKLVLSVIPHDGYVVIIFLYKSIECVTPRVKLYVNHGLWVIMPCPHRFIDCKKVPLCLVGDVGNEGGLWGDRKCVGTLCTLCCKNFI